VADEIDRTELTVAQMAAATGVSAHTLRYYERAGLIRPVGRNGGNQRRYRPGDVEWVHFLLRLRATGMSIAQMRGYADLRHQGSATVRPRLELLTEHRRELRAQLDRLRAHDEALEAKIATYQLMLAAQHVDDHREEAPHE
jgi:DNA-binding transcriptional MerR regulator